MPIKSLCADSDTKRTIYWCKEILPYHSTLPVTTRDILSLSIGPFQSMICFIPSRVGGILSINGALSFDKDLALLILSVPLHSIEFS